MPLTPSTYLANQPVAASQFNTDLYTYSPGNNHTPNGILFHATPPMAMSNLRDTTALGTQPSSAGGSLKSMESNGSWRAAIDNNALFATGGDFMGPNAAGHYLPTVPGSAGSVTPTISIGGTYLAWGVCVFSSTTTADNSGCTLYYGGATAARGGMQLSSTTRDNASYVVDLMTVNPPNATNLGGFCADTGANFTYGKNSVDYVGETSHFGMLWTGYDPAVNSTVLGSLPTPTTGYSSASTITAAGLNGNGLGGPLAFLNNRPQMRASGLLATSIPNSANIGTVTTKVPLNSADIDPWGSFNTTTNTFTAPVSGVYLVHGSVAYSVATGSNRVAGFQVNGTQNIWGPAYQNAGLQQTKPQCTRLLDLQAGDTLTLVTCQNSGGATPLSNVIACRLVVVWMAALAGSNGSVSWTAPDTGFRWQAGTPGSLLPAQFQAHLANDLSFLIQRPYLMAYQSTAQSGLAQNTFQVINVNTLGGRIHNSAGDNYGGWTSGAGNVYSAVVPGWYLAVSHTAQAIPGSTPAHPLAAIGYLDSTGAAQGSAAQQWGQHVRTTSGSYQPGAEAIGLFYLRAGDQLQPQYQQQDGGATFATSVGVSGLESSFGCVWVSE
jgi:hypothetical protein